MRAELRIAKMRGRVRRNPREEALRVPPVPPSSHPTLSPTLHSVCHPPYPVIRQRGVGRFRAPPTTSSFLNLHL